MSAPLLPSGTAPVIRLEGVSRIYGEGDAAVHALHDVTLEIMQRDFVAVMGASGSGKSTCMNILGCLDVPTSGTYFFSGVPVQTLTRDQRALLRRNYLGFVFQGFNLLSRTTALENVELPLIYRGMDSQTRQALARAALKDVGLEGRESHAPNELSGGQQQRVAIARAMVTQPRVLLADEPTGNLDTARSMEIMRLIETLNHDRGITVVMVTHEVDVARFARRVVRFRDGAIVAGEA